MPQHPRQPHMSHPHPRQRPQCRIIHPRKCPAPVLIPPPPLYPTFTKIGKMAHKKLVNHRSHALILPHTPPLGKFLFRKNSPATQLNPECVPIQRNSAEKLLRVTVLIFNGDSAGPLRRDRKDVTESLGVSNHYCFRVLPP